ncbi:regulator of chromosome condensation 1/beta-lactamase-inhibitor protein II, partial [Phakopsora pachyrhizi]
MPPKGRQPNRSTKALGKTDEERQLNKAKSNDKKLNKPASKTTATANTISSSEMFIDPILQAETLAISTISPTKPSSLSPQSPSSFHKKPSTPRKRGRPPKLEDQNIQPSKKNKHTQNGHGALKPLFNSLSIRGTAFNPLPAPDPLFNIFNNDGDQEQFHINPRSTHKLNRFNFNRPDWLSKLLSDSKVDDVDISKKPDSKKMDRFLLMFGSGDMGQMGLGVEKLEDIKKPVIHELIESLKAGSELSAGPETVSCGGMHTLLVDGKGQVWSWGINDNAALGRKTEGIEGVEQEELESRPLRVEKLSEDDQSIFRAVRVEAGDSVSVAVSDRGELRAWGSFRSNDGILGFDGKVGSSTKQLVPTPVGNLTKHHISQVACGYDHVLALTTDGHVYSWGNGQQNQLGRKIIERRKKNGLVPERLSLKKIVLVGSGGSHSFAVNEAGEVFGWGLNTRGQLGISEDNKSSEEEIVSVPTLISSMSPSNHNGSRVVAIHGGDFHTLFLLSNGQVWGVGSYENGEVGLPKTHPAIVDVERQRLEGLKKKQDFLGTNLKKRREKFEAELKKFEARVEKDGDWSKEEIVSERPIWDEMTESMEVEQEAANLRLVPGQSINRPIRLDFSKEVIDISCGARHNLAVDADGNAYSWGLGQSNELGLGKDEDGEDIEMVETPKLLKSKALSANGVNGLGQIKVLKCEAGGTHSVLIGVSLINSKIVVNG